MIRCAKCDNETRTSTLVTAAGEVMLAGTIGSDPQPIVAQVCTACGYVELYAPQPIGDTLVESSEAAEPAPETIPVPAV